MLLNGEEHSGISTYLETKNKLYNVTAIPGKLFIDKATKFLWLQALKHVNNRLTCDWKFLTLYLVSTGQYAKCMTHIREAW